jgi:hypothetical protein
MTTTTQNLWKTQVHLHQGGNDGRTPFTPTKANIIVAPLAIRHQEVFARVGVE